MIISDLNFRNTHIIQPKVFNDNRGLFFESFNINKLNKIFNSKISQINHSFSKKNVIRGIHLQHKDPQHQFFYVSQGRVKVVLVDFRFKSNTFLKKIYINLAESNPKIIHTPPGVGTSFLTLKKANTMMYFVSKTYNPDNELGILWNDPTLNIKWQIKNPIISNKDSSNLLVKDLKFNNFNFKI